MTTSAPARPPARLRVRRSDPSRPGLTRLRRGSGFRYVDAAGAKVTDPDDLERIAALVIPPAWKDVWICPHANGHLQAVGTDEAGRRQYLYHARWSELRSREKFERMRGFADALPQIRERVSGLLDTEDGATLEPTRERVLALAVRLLDRGYFRIGNEQYVAEHGSFGLLTLRRTHVVLEPPDAMVFDFPAKHGIRMIRRISDASTFAMVDVLRRRRSGPEALFAAREPGAKSWAPVVAGDVNAFLKESAGIDCSAKDFRTWHGTVLCAVALASVEADVIARGRQPRRSESAIKREVAAAVRETSDFLGNTPAVARSSYIDPRVIDRYRDGRTIQPGIDRLLRLNDVEALDVQLVAEAATLRLLEDRTPQTIARAAERVIAEELAHA
ncbi:MAG: topoisomerase [Thermoleophilia bacterium]|nr:topoisomerase [Thermoleophilia bacterium]